MQTLGYIAKYLSELEHEGQCLIVTSNLSPDDEELTYIESVEFYIRQILDGLQVDYKVRRFNDKKDVLIEICE